MASNSFRFCLLLFEGLLFEVIPQTVSNQACLFHSPPLLSLSHTYIHTHTHTYTHAHTHTHTHIHTHTHTHTHISTRAHEHTDSPCTHTDAHTYRYTHTHRHPKKTNRQKHLVSLIQFH